MKVCTCMTCPAHGRATDSVRTDLESADGLGAPMPSEAQEPRGSQAGQNGPRARNRPHDEAGQPGVVESGAERQVPNAPSPAPARGPVRCRKCGRTGPVATEYYQPTDLCPLCVNEPEQRTAEAAPEPCQGTPGAASWQRCEKPNGHAPPCTHDPDPSRYEAPSEPLELQFARWIHNKAKVGVIHDHACAECTPHGDIVVAGYQCTVHAARARVKQDMVQQRSSEAREPDPCQFPGCHGSGTAHILECPNAPVPIGPPLQFSAPPGTFEEVEARTNEAQPDGLCDIHECSRCGSAWAPQRPTPEAMAAIDAIPPPCTDNPRNDLECKSCDDPELGPRSPSEMTHCAGCYFALELAHDALRKERDKFKERADVYEKDWYEAKSEFGDAMAKARARIAELEAQCAETALRTFKVGQRVRIVDCDAEGHVVAPDEARFCVVTVQLIGESKMRLFRREDVVPSETESTQCGGEARVEKP